MAPTEQSLVLAGEFPATDRATWEALAGDVDALRSTTYDGITVDPLYTAEDEITPVGLPGFSPFVRGRTAAGMRRTGWDVRQLVDVRTDSRRGAAVDELEGGATSVWLRLHDQVADDVAESLIARVLDGALFEVAPVVIDAGQRWSVAGEVLCNLWDRQNIDPALVRGSFGADPFGEWASNRGRMDLDGYLEDFSAAASRSRKYPNVRLATIDGTRFHDAGASDAQELGFTVANALSALRIIGEDDHDAVSVFGQIELRLAATVDQFATIAKFRAARRLWARVAEIAGDPRAAGRTPVHAVTSTAMMTRYDPAVNMLRGTVACFAAGVAGADAVTVIPYDAFAAERPSELGRRVARNTQSMLAMESHLARVIDPAGGSWYVERLTSDLAHAAWDVFQEVEQAGGFGPAVEAGIVNERIAGVRAQRSADVDRRRAPITGVTEFPNLGDRPAVLDAPAEQPADGSLVRYRWAEDFEQLRQRVDDVAAQSARPSVHLATLGPPAAFTARAMFAKNLFEVAGIETRLGPANADVDQAGAAFDAGSTCVACICSSDARYGTDGAELAATLSAAGASRIYLAGRPGDLIDQLTAAGVTHTITAGSDARATLADLLEHLGVA